MLCELIIFKFLTLLFSSGQEKNFNKYPASEVDFAGGMYDFDSLMHYGNYAFSKNRKPTLVALKNPKLQFGRTLKLSKTDILQLNAMYDCKSKRFLRKVTTYFFNRPPLSSSSSYPSACAWMLRTTVDLPAYRAVLPLFYCIDTALKARSLLREFYGAN